MHSVSFAGLLVAMAVVGVVQGVEISAPSGSHVTEGSSVQLVCRGEGVLVWVWEGERITSNTSHFTLNDNGSLVISHLSHDLAGDDTPYICTNGTHNDTITITIASEHGHGTDVADQIRSIVIGCVIGVGGATVIAMVIILAFLYSCYSKDKVSDMDSLEYVEYEEIEPRLNLENLSKLEPAVRAKIDLPFLARLTNTDPATLSKYQVKEESGGESSDKVSQSGGAKSPTSTSNKSLSSSFSCQVSLIKPHPPPATPPLRRVRTVTDFSNSKPPTNSKRLLSASFSADTRQGSIRSSSQPAIAGELSGEEKEMRKDLLQLLTLVQKQKEEEEGSSTKWIVGE